MTSHTQVSKLYEELECQISGERSKVALEHSQKEARALASLETEVRKITFLDVLRQCVKHDVFIS